MFNLDHKICNTKVTNIFNNLKNQNFKFPSFNNKNIIINNSLSQTNGVNINNIYKIASRCNNIKIRSLEEVSKEIITLLKLSSSWRTFPYPTSLTTVFKKEYRCQEYIQNKLQSSICYDIDNIELLSELYDQKVVRSLNYREYESKFALLYNSNFVLSLFSDIKDQLFVMWVLSLKEV